MQPRVSRTNYHSHAKSICMQERKMNPLKPEQKNITPIEECRAKGYRLTKTSRRSRESIVLKVCISWLLSKCIESLSTYHPIFSLFLRPLVPPPPPFTKQHLPLVPSSIQTKIKFMHSISEHTPPS